MNLTQKEWEFLFTYLNNEVTQTKTIVQDMMVSKTSMIEEVTKTVDNIEMLCTIVHKIEKYLGDNHV